MGRSRLKPGWTRVAFGDVAVSVNDRIDNPLDAGVERYVGLEHLDSDSLAIRRWAPPTAVTATKLLFRRGDIIFGRRRAYQRKLAVADFDGICSAHALVLRAKSRVVLPEFLPFFMQSDSFMRRAEAISVGSLSPTINWRTLASEEFALPPPDEQRRIATVLAGAARSMDASGTLVHASRQLERATFDALLANTPGRSTTLGPLLLARPRNGSSAVEAASATGHWVLSLSALGKDGYRTGHLKSVHPTAAMLAARLQLGDLLISRSNTLELVGTAGTFEEDRADVSWPDTMMRLVPDTCRIRSRFLELFLRSSSGRRQIQSFAAGTSASMKKINASTVQKIRITVPPLHLQDRIIAATGTIRSARASAERHLAELLAWRNRWLNRVLGANRHSRTSRR